MKIPPKAGWKIQMPALRSPTISDCLDPAFWGNLNPHLLIGETRPQPRARRILNNEVASEHRRLVHDGYCVLRSVFAGVEAESLRLGIENLVAAGYLPVFIFVYDAFWTLLPGLEAVLRHIFEPRFLVQANFWAWRVPNRDGALGFTVHRDRYEPLLFPSGAPKAMNLWVALSDANLQNGCLHVLPALADRNYPRHLGNQDISDPDSALALPVRAGSIVGLGANVLHWSGISSAAAPGPRVSASIEIQSHEIEPLSSVVFSPSEIPNFETRLSLIAHQIAIYGHHEEVSDQARDTADRLRAVTTAARTRVSDGARRQNRLSIIRSYYDALHVRLQRGRDWPGYVSRYGIWVPSDFDDLCCIFRRYGGGRMLDLGCGDGIVAAVAAHFCTEAVGIEADPFWRGLAEQAVKSLGIDNASIVGGDYGQYSLSDFDVIFLSPDRPFTIDLEQKLMRELDGRLIVYCPVYRPQGLREIESFSAGSKDVAVFVGRLVDDDDEAPHTLSNRTKGGSR